VKRRHADLICHAPSLGVGLSVDNFVKNFFMALVFENSGTALWAKIHTLKFKILNEIKGLRERVGLGFKNAPAQHGGRCLWSTLAHCAWFLR
jgi:hypothetical protein